MANHSILKQRSLQLGAVGWFWRNSVPIAPHMIIQRTERSGELNISEVIFIVLQNTWFESSSLSTVNLDKKNYAVPEISNFS